MPKYMCTYLMCLTHLVSGQKAQLCQLYSNIVEKDTVLLFTFKFYFHLVHDFWHFFLQI